MKEYRKGPERIRHVGDVPVQMDLAGLRAIFSEIDDLFGLIQRLEQEEDEVRCEYIKTGKVARWDEVRDDTD